MPLVTMPASFSLFSGAMSLLIATKEDPGEMELALGLIGGENNAGS